MECAKIHVATPDTYEMSSKMPNFTPLYLTWCQVMAATIFADQTLYKNSDIGASSIGQPEATNFGHVTRCCKADKSIKTFQHPVTERQSSTSPVSITENQWRHYVKHWKESGDYRSRPTCGWDEHPEFRKASLENIASDETFQLYCSTCHL